MAISFMGVETINSPSANMPMKVKPSKRQIQVRASGKPIQQKEIHTPEDQNCPHTEGQSLLKSRYCFSFLKAAANRLCSSTPCLKAKRHGRAVRT